MLPHLLLPPHVCQHGTPELCLGGDEGLVSTHTPVQRVECDRALGLLQRSPDQCGSSHALGQSLPEGSLAHRCGSGRSGRHGRRWITDWHSLLGSRIRDWGSSRGRGLSGVRQVLPPQFPQYDGFLHHSRDAFYEAPAAKLLLAQHFPTSSHTPYRTPVSL